MIFLIILLSRMKISVSTDISVLGFYGYIGYIGDISDISEIYRIYRRYIGEYFYMNIDISEIKLLLSIHNRWIKSEFQIWSFKYISDISRYIPDISRYISDILPKN